MSKVIACIDGSGHSAAVADSASWASQRLQAPLTLLHVLDSARFPIATDLSGSIGLGSREHLLEELAALDERRGKLALEQGRLWLEAAKSRCLGHGIEQVQLRQRHGAFVDSVKELEAETRLLVMGRSGVEGGHLVGSHVESVLRSLQRPILLTTEQFKTPQSLMLAFDASATSRKSVELLAASPLLKGLPVHLVTVGRDTPEQREPLEWARTTLAASGISAQTAIVTGEVAPALQGYQAEHGLGLLVMGAYGQSRIREFLVGSTTSAMLRSARTPLLVLR